MASSFDEDSRPPSSGSSSTGCRSLGSFEVKYSTCIISAFGGSPVVMPKSGERMTCGRLKIPS